MWRITAGDPSRQVTAPCPGEGGEGGGRKGLRWRLLLFKMKTPICEVTPKDSINCHFLHLIIYTLVSSAKDDKIWIFLYMRVGCDVLNDMQYEILHPHFKSIYRLNTSVFSMYWLFLSANRFA